MKEINVEFLGNYYGKVSNFDGSVYSRGGVLTNIG